MSDRLSRQAILDEKIKKFLAVSPQTSFFRVGRCCFSAWSCSRSLRTFLLASDSFFDIKPKSMVSPAAETRNEQPNV
jgi:hypothetical protein